MPNIINCSKCQRNIVKGSFNKTSGKFICKNCIISNNDIYKKYRFSLLHQLTSIHLDQLNSLHFNNNDIFDSIAILDLFLSYHIVELKHARY